MKNRKAIKFTRFPSTVLFSCPHFAHSVFSSQSWYCFLFFIKTSSSSFFPSVWLQSDCHSVGISFAYVTVPQPSHLTELSQLISGLAVSCIRNYKPLSPSSVWLAFASASQYVTALCLFCHPLINIFSMFISMRSFFTTNVTAYLICLSLLLESWELIGEEK